MYGWVNLSTFSSYSILPYWLADTCTVDQQSTRSFKACKRETHISRFAWIDMKSTFVLCDTECEVTKIKTLTDSITWDEENTSSWIPDYVYFGGRSLSVLYTHTHTHTHHLWYVVLSIWAMFQSSRKSSPGCHVTLWSIMKASSWSLTPIIPTDHHSHDTLPTLHWPCLYMCVCWIHVCVSDGKKECCIQVDIHRAPGYWQNDDEDETDMCRQQRGNLFEAFYAQVSSEKADGDEHYQRQELLCEKSLPFCSITNLM